jgi:hypothetical protein
MNNTSIVKAKAKNSAPSETRQTKYIADSDALRDFVYETNRGGHVSFAPSLEEFKAAEHRSGEHAPSPRTETTRIP